MKNYIVFVVFAFLIGINIKPEEITNMLSTENSQLFAIDAIAAASAEINETVDSLGGTTVNGGQEDDDDDDGWFESLFGDDDDDEYEDEDEDEYEDEDEEDDD